MSQNNKKRKIEKKLARLVLTMALIQYAMNRMNLASFISKRKNED
jgi:hypothetical protein